MYRSDSGGDPCGTFLSHVGGHLHILRCVLLLSSHFGGTIARVASFHFWGPLLDIFRHISPLKVPFTFPKVDYIFEGIPHHWCSFGCRYTLFEALHIFGSMFHYWRANVDPLVYFTSKFALT